ncbi:MAG: RHS repeat-associated core domain-containing protein [Planctomycetota bacterium]
MVGWGNDWWGQTEPPEGNDFVAISAGEFHGLAMKSDGTIVVWGNNDAQQLRTPTIMVFERYSYYAFGETTIRDTQGDVRSSSAFGNRFMFTGREYNSETGLYYYRTRYYKPSIGRFLQTDPVRYYGGLNLYTYCGNNPLNWLDPWGLATVRIYTDNGVTTLIDPTMDEFRNAIKSEKDCSINRINISGHGSRNAMMIVRGRNPNDGSLYWITGSDQVQFSDNYENFSDFIRSKLANGAVIELDGCNTARQWTRRSNNISRQLSRELPDSTVRGNRGAAIANEWYGIRFGRETHAIGFKREYHGGN